MTNLLEKQKSDKKSVQTSFPDIKVNGTKIWKLNYDHSAGNWCCFSKTRVKCDKYIAHCTEFMLIKDQYSPVGGNPSFFIDRRHEDHGMSDYMVLAI